MEGVETNEYRLRANKAVKDDGGPAFPAPEAAKARFGDSNPDAFIGMALRDYFAVKVFAASIAGGYWNHEDRTSEHMAMMAYKHADNLLAERAK